MDRYRMTRPDCRPGCAQPMPCQPSCKPQYQPPCQAPVQPNECEAKPCGIYHHADELPVAMAYVPMQQFKTTFELCKALSVGTVFPELCKPFVGKRGRVC